MSPGLGAILFGGLGYVLVYASVANHGRFALHPWLGLLADAYTGETSTAPDAASSGSSGSSAPAQRDNARPAALVQRGSSLPRNRAPLQVQA
jgi:hypothetical protein